jgi:hypothetical protein
MSKRAAAILGAVTFVVLAVICAPHASAVRDYPHCPAGACWRHRRGEGAGGRSDRFTGDDLHAFLAETSRTRCAEERLRAGASSYRLRGGMLPTSDAGSVDTL